MLIFSKKKNYIPKYEISNPKKQHQKKGFECPTKKETIRV